MAVALATTALCFTVPALIKKAKSKAVVTVQVREQELHLITSDEFGGGQSWETDFVFTNVSDVPFTPESIVAYFYEGNRLDDKIKLNYDEICGYMDTGKLRQQDTPITINFGTNHLYLTHIKAAIFGTDDNGNELQFYSEDIVLQK